MGKFDYSTITGDVQYALRRWAFHGEYPGSFLSSVLENDLLGAVSQADNHNSNSIAQIVMFLYNRAPSRCWGSLEKFTTWPERLKKMCRAEGTVFYFGPFDEGEEPECFKV